MQNHSVVRVFEIFVMYINANRINVHFHIKANESHSSNKCLYCFPTSPHPATKGISPADCLGIAVSILLLTES